MGGVGVRGVGEGGRERERRLKHKEWLLEEGGADLIWAILGWGYVIKNRG